MPKQDRCGEGEVVEIKSVLSKPFNLNKQINDKGKKKAVIEVKRKVEGTY